VSLRSAKLSLDRWESPLESVNGCVPAVDRKRGSMVGVFDSLDMIGSLKQIGSLYSFVNQDSLKTCEAFIHLSEPMSYDGA
jgi:hypothetical protein